MAINDPSVLSLLENTNTRYTLCVLAAKRARQIIGGSQPVISTKETKPLTIAVNEIDCGLIPYQTYQDNEE